LLPVSREAFLIKYVLVVRAKEKQMASKKIWLGMLAIVLTFGLPVAVYGQALNGIWYWDEYPNDPDMALKLNNGKIDSEYLRGTYTTRNNEITITVTHILGTLLAELHYYFGMSGITAFEWYSREQMANLLRNHPLNVMKKLSEQEINEMLDMVYSTETVPIIGGNRFKFFMEHTYIRGNATSQPQQQNQAPVAIAPVQPAPAPIANEDYVLPYSSTRELTDNDLRRLTKNELRLARNEIYARYGRVFRDQSLQKYFDSKSWYKNLPKLPLGTDPTLTKLERSNIELIQVYEAK
jgi:hypothetical protein